MGKEPLFTRPSVHNIASSVVGYSNWGMFDDDT